MVIRRVGPLSCAKIAGVLYAALGALFAVFIALFALAGAFAQTGFGGTGALVAIAAIIIGPALYGCFGFVFALVAATFYNFAAGRVGGVEVDMQ
jgi:hypothetical protein